MNTTELNTMQELDNLMTKYGNIGNGNSEAKCLLIIPKPKCDPDIKAAYNFNSPELNTMKGIFNKLEIDPHDWWITTAVDDSGIVSMPRLCDIVYSISPKLIILAGEESCRAFFGNEKDANEVKYGYGKLLCFNFIVYHVIDFSEYFKLKEENPSMSEEFANKLFQQWKNIKVIYDEIK